MGSLRQAQGKPFSYAQDDRLKKLLCLTILVALVIGAASAQEAADVGRDQNQGQKQADKPAPSGAEGSVGPAQSPATQAPSTQEKPEVKITPRQAEELFHSVD